MLILTWSIYKHGHHRQGNSCFWLAYFLKSSPLKPLSQMNRNLVGSIYGRSSIKMLISSRSINKHGRHRQFMLMIVYFLKKNICLCGKGDNSNLNIDTMNWITDKYASKTLSQMNWNLVGSIYGRPSYKDCSFCPNPFTNMATTGNFCFWLAYF